MPLARSAALFAVWILLTLAGCGAAPVREPAPESAVAVRERSGSGIQMLEPYDPKRIPVLFVHGIGGTPEDFRAMLDGLDRARFQAWVFRYPTGLSLGTASRALHAALAELQREHRVEALFIVAHSMGGLVSRGYLVDALRDEGGGPARLLVTLSSPWEGNEWAQAGARFMPGAPGVWTDLSPASDFLVALRKPVPRVPHYVFYGYRRVPSLLTPESSDGAITLASQIPAWIQEQAERCWGFDADHAGVLSHRAVLEQLNALLAAEADRQLALRPLVDDALRLADRALDGADRHEAHVR